MWLGSRRVVRALLALMVLTLLFATACRSGTSTDGGPDAAPNAAADEIVIGVSGPLTGDRAEYGKIWRRGFDLALDEINQNSGVRGRSLRYVFEDTQSDPKQTPAVAQKFVADPAVVAVIGDFSSPASMAASPIYQRAGLVQLGITNSHPDFTQTGDYIWSNSSSQTDDAPALAKLAAEELGKKRLALLHQNTDWGQATADLFVEAAAELGAEVVVREAYLPDEKEFRSVLSKVRDAKPDALVLISYYNDAALIVQQRQAVELDVPIVGVSSIYSPQFVRLAGEAAEGVYTSVRFHPDDPRPEVQAFVQAFRQRYGEDPDSFAAVAYDGVKLLAAVMEQYGVERQAIRDGLADIRDLTTVVYGTSSFGPDRRLLNPRFLTLVVENGEFTLAGK